MSLDVNVGQVFQLVAGDRRRLRCRDVGVVAGRRSRVFGEFAPLRNGRGRQRRTWPVYAAVGNLGWFSSVDVVRCRSTIPAADMKGLFAWWIRRVLRHG